VDIRAGRIDAFFLFDVAESAELPAIPALISAETVPARLAPKRATPVYDYGVVSVALQRPFEGAWVIFRRSARC
jgi:hypothetical protein